MKNKLYHWICIVVMTTGLFGCDEFLDRAPGLNLDEDKVFSTYETAYRFHADIYSNLRKGFNILGSFQPVPLACASDEAEGSSGWHSSNNLNTGAYDGIDDVLFNDYEGIRKANLFLSKTSVIPFPDEETKKHLLGEVYFLRAFYFHDVIKRYGGMPLLNDIILYPNDKLNVPRSSYKTCVEAILADLEKAIPMLPYSVGSNESGRATKGAAMALKARLLLYAASPLWNNEFTNADKWQLAANAALDVIDLKENGTNVYALYNTGAGANDYEQQFFVRPPDNREVIFWYNDEPKKFDADEIMVWAPSGEGFLGAGAVWPTQNFVDLYETKNGKTIDEDSEYNPLQPCENRDPRFYRTILYNGAVWQDVTVETFVGGKHRLKTTDCRTSYYVRKYLPESVRSTASTASYHNWQFMRLAELYLNYAEAINEAEGPGKAYWYINEIRNRSGMPDLPGSLTQAQMRERIKRERAVELAFEEHRWWDVRRWMEGDKYFNGAFYGMDIVKNADGTFTSNRVVFETRVFTSKMNLYPIPISEMNKNDRYVQNQGW
ncbi:carbohydrate-binding protein [Bacteroidia bacterium]|nr:carbohydrate-binding protein [Bacteroidia bacterium]